MSLVATSPPSSDPTAAMTTAPAPPGALLDLAELSVTAVNTALQDARAGAFTVAHPAGRHNLAVGLDSPVEVTIDGHAGYYCGGMNQQAQVRVLGNVAVGCGENAMSGRIDVHGAAGQALGASAHGGLISVRGNAGARCGISLKGGDIVVGGSVGHATGFMSQKGRIVICGDAGEALGDSLYEARIYVAGVVASLGADCIEKPLREEHRAELAELLAAAGIDGDPAEFRRYGSARRLYHFTADRVEAA